MTVKAPQDKCFKAAKKWYCAYLISMICGFIVSALNSGLIECLFDHASKLSPEAINICSYLLIISAFILSNMYNSAYLKAEEVRRSVFLDNTYGTKLVPDISEHYYDTEEIKEGTGKLLANLHQSALYTSRIAGKMRWLQVIIVIIPLIFLLTFAYSGFKNSPLSILVLEIFLSTVLLYRLVALGSLAQATTVIEQQVCQLWEQKGSKKLPQVLNLLLKYDTELASDKIILNQWIKKTLNAELEREWQKRKERYSIK
jgi:ABC-type multidrug transport system fused ATPase/permease subunit